MEGRTVIAATWPRDDVRATRLLRIYPARGVYADGRIADLLTLLRSGDVLVVNDAATLPASLRGSAASGAPVEARLAGHFPDGRWRAVLFGDGDWRVRTEDRPPPPRLAPGDTIDFDGLRARVNDVDADSPRLVSLTFDKSGDAVWPALYRAGRPVQYSYTDAPLAIWHVQTAYAARPWAAEAPSAGFPLTWELLLELRRRGVTLTSVTLAAGLSSTGEPSLDARLPLAESYEVSPIAVEAIDTARERGGRVVAVGTTVTRALEAAATAAGGRIDASRGTTELVLGAQISRNVVDGILTGIHEADTSHFRLLEAFAPRRLLEDAHAFAAAHGYRGHEFGDAVVILPAGDSL